jgi:hypothetical protein
MKPTGGMSLPGDEEAQIQVAELLADVLDELEGTFESRVTLAGFLLSPQPELGDKTTLEGILEGEREGVMLAATRLRARLEH